jgi:hypothetical protein
MGTRWHRPRSHPAADGTFLRYDGSVLCREISPEHATSAFSMKLGSQIGVLENMENEAAA